MFTRRTSETAAKTAGDTAAKTTGETAAKTRDMAAPPAVAETAQSIAKAGGSSVISHQLSVHGDFSSTGDILIDGTVEGDVTAKVLAVGEGGSIKGAITADSVTIAGTVNGQIRAKIVSLSRTARVQGEIWNESISIEQGARFEGSCKNLSSAAAEGEVASWAKARRAAAGASSGAEGAVVEKAQPG